jgi:hypothetical protein
MSGTVERIGAHGRVVDCPLCGTRWELGYDPLVEDEVECSCGVVLLIEEVAA